MGIVPRTVDALQYLIWEWGPRLGEHTVPFIVIALLGTGIFFTFRLRFIQIRGFAHGLSVTAGRYSTPHQAGDVSPFQALSTALAATVGIGNIAGVALALHFGGPGALFWMWVTALFGMALKYAEVTLAQHYRQNEVQDDSPASLVGSVSGGPMFYIERGLGRSWRPLAILTALGLIAGAFLAGNAIQANTVADVVRTEFGVPPWATGAITSSVLALVSLGGIRRIGSVAGVLTPTMATVYVAGGVGILILNREALLPALGSVFSGAFDPTAGVAGAGSGAFLLTLIWGVRRGLFSNEAGMGSAPIVHAAARTDEPVSEGLVALLEPFIDTIVICTITGLVILVTGVLGEPVATEISLSSGNLGYTVRTESGLLREAPPPAAIRVDGGEPIASVGGHLAWHGYPIERLFSDPEHTRPFAGQVLAGEGRAIAEDGSVVTSLYADAPQTGASLTRTAFRRGYAALGSWGGYIVLVSVILFAMSTAISWSYYGDRCANYLLGHRAIAPFKIAFVGVHFAGAVFSLSTVWKLGDIGAGFVVFPNLLALLLLSGVVVEVTRSYFRREPWRGPGKAQTGGRGPPGAAPRTDSSRELGDDSAGAGAAAGTDPPKPRDPDRR